MKSEIVFVIVLSLVVYKSAQLKYSRVGKDKQCPMFVPQRDAESHFIPTLVHGH